MKRIFALCFTLLLLVTGCSATASTNSTTQNITEISVGPKQVENEQITINFAFGTRTGTYSGTLNADGLPDGFGKFVSKNAMGAAWEYEGDWKAGHWEGFGTSIWSSGLVYTGEFQNDSETGQGTLTLASGEKYIGSFINRVIRGEGELIYPDGGSFKGNFTDLDNAVGTYTDVDGTTYEAVIENGEITLTPLLDFFSDVDRQEQYKEMYESYCYSELIAYVNEYLSANKVSSLDSAYSILELLTPAAQYEESWNISFDEFDSKYKLSFDGAENITAGNSVAVSVCGTGLDIIVGFIKTGWLFFDEIELSIDGERVYSAGVKSYNCTRNVISGNTIEEFCKCSFYDSVLKQIGTAETVILRFSNQASGENYDHTLTDSEKDALYCGLLLRINNKELSDLLYHYNNK